MKTYFKHLFKLCKKPEDFETTEEKFSHSKPGGIIFLPDDHFHWECFHLKRDPRKDAHPEQEKKT